MLDAYRSVLDYPGDRSVFYLDMLARLFYETGHPAEAEKLYENLISRSQYDPEKLQASLGNQTNILRVRGDFDGAMALYKEQERICRELGNLDGLQASLGNQALILYTRGDLDGAMELHKEKERICRELGNVEGLAYSLVNQALNSLQRGDRKTAGELITEAYRLASEHGYQALAQQNKGFMEQTGLRVALECLKPQNLPRKTDIKHQAIY